VPRPEAQWGRARRTTQKKYLLLAILECFLLSLGVFDRAVISLRKGSGAHTSQRNRFFEKSARLRHVELKCMGR
jgi:hypothetical protein